VSTSTKLPQPYRYKVAAAKFKSLGGRMEVQAPEGIPEPELNVLTEALELFGEIADRKKERK
jgi:hypothetical protein